MKANMPFKTQPIRNMKTGKEDTKKRTPRLVNVKSYNLDALGEFALDNNYIEGAKHELAKGIVKGVIEAQRARVKISDDTFFGEIRGKCAEAGSVLDTAAGVTAKVTFADGTVLTHDATIADA